MINRYFKERKRQDVAGLNKFRILINRSETEKTETGWDYWQPALEGAVQRHTGKDLVFYIIEGEGEIRLGDQIVPMKEDNLLYVPDGVLHQVLTQQDTPLCYMLFTVFNDPSKEESIAHVDQIRKPIFLQNPDQGKVYEFGSNTTTLLLERNKTNKVELALIRWPEGSKGAMAAHKDKEQTFYILSGRGNVTIDGDTEEVLPGHVVFVPRNTPHTSEALEGELVYICLNALVNPADESFDNMYQRIIPHRMERWKKGIDDIGE
jgi:mannose-6-phosphate isomerase-like protein (cupin superfamily)